jgi:hypothetical protein
MLASAPHGSPRSNSSAEDLALIRAAGGPLHEPAPVADTLGGDQYTLGVQPVQNIVKALALLPDKAARGDLDVIEEELVGLVVHHHPDRPYAQPVRHRLLQIDQKDREAAGPFLYFLERGGAGEQDHEVRVLYARDVDLAAVHHVAIAFAHGRGP